MFILFYQYRKCLCLSVALEVAKSFYLATGIDFFFLGIEKGDINFSVFSVEGDQVRSVYISTSCFKRKKTCMVCTDFKKH